MRFRFSRRAEADLDQITAYTRATIPHEPSPLCAS
jgi:plasmid stabilization system protein ParE